MKIFIPGLNDPDLKYREEETQLQRLSRWANIYGDFKVAHSYLDEKGIHHFSKHRSVLECLETDWEIEFLEKANHRQILPIELVFDLDEKPTLEDFNKLCDHLDSYGESYFGFFTGSKGYHIHSFNYDLVNIPQQHTKFLKEHILEEWNADLHKSSDKVMIAMEYQAHWKTGKQKRVIRNGRFN